MNIVARYQRNVARKTVVGLPVEDVVYAAFVNIVIFHKKPPSRFTIYLQMSPVRYTPPPESEHGTYIGEMSQLATLCSLHLHYIDVIKSLSTLYITRG